MSTETQEMMYSHKRQQYLVDQGYAFKILNAADLDWKSFPQTVYVTEAEQRELLTLTLEADDSAEVRAWACCCARSAPHLLRQREERASLREEAGAVARTSQQAQPAKRRQGALGACGTCCGGVASLTLACATHARRAQRCCPVVGGRPTRSFRQGESEGRWYGTCGSAAGRSPSRATTNESVLLCSVDSLNLIARREKRTFRPTLQLDSPANEHREPSNACMPLVGT